VLVAAGCGAIATALAWNCDLATRALIGWDVGVGVLLLGIVHTMTTASLAELKKIASKEDSTATVILFLMLGAIAASLVGVVAEIGAARSADMPQAALFMVLGVLTLALSWFTMHLSFALHYAHRYYGDRDSDDVPDGGLVFPEAADETDTKPSYLEFVYFAVCLGMTCQVSDVVVQSQVFRRLVTIHGVLSFFYNIFILGLAVNLFSSLGAR